jgi:cell wall-associated NlpC family hydrolase
MQINDLFLSPFVAGGRDANGYDCFGLFQELCRRRGIAVPEQVQPSFPPEGAGRDAEIMGQAVVCGWHPVDKPFAGCAVALRVGGWVSHMGMVLDDAQTFIHTNEKTGVTVSRLDDPKWAKRIAGFYFHD